MYTVISCECCVTCVPASKTFASVHLGALTCEPALKYFRHLVLYLRQVENPIDGDR